MRAQSFIAAFFGLSSLAAAADCPVADVSIIAHSGTPVGREEVHEGGKSDQSLMHRPSCPVASEEDNLG